MWSEVPIYVTLPIKSIKQIIMKHIFLSAVLSMALSPLYGVNQKQLTVQVTNPTKTERIATPVIIQLSAYDIRVQSAVVMEGNQEIPSQLDDLNGDGIYDELCFLADLDKKGKRQFAVTLSDEGSPNAYPSKVYAEMMMSNKKIKASNKQDLYISSLTVENGTNLTGCCTTMVQPLKMTW